MARSPARGEPLGGLGALVAVLLLGACGPDGPPPEIDAFAGVRTGTFSILGDSVTVVLDVSTDGSSDLSGRVSLPAQAIYDVVADVDIDGRDLAFELPTLRSRYTGRLRDDGSFRGDWWQAGGKFRLTLSPGGRPAAPTRPQEPVGDVPYIVDSLRVPGGAPGVVLSGTLTRPDGPGPHVAAVLVSGSGAQNRDEELFGHKPFLVLADHLTRHGLAVFRYDDRGVADSEGDFGSATTEDFASDALAAVAALRARPDIDSSLVGIIGHSEGGIVAPMAAARSEDVAFIVSLAGTGIDGRELLKLQTELIMEASDLPAPIIALNRRLQDEVFDKLEEAGSAEGAIALAHEELRAQHGGLPYAVITALGMAAQVDRALEEQMRAVASPWLFFFLDYDPTEAFQRVTVPVLALNGSLDLQVPPEPNLRLIEEAVRRGGNDDITAIVFEGLNHLFQHATTGLPSEYGRIEETIAPDVLEVIAEWILDLDVSDRTRPR